MSRASMFTAAWLGFIVIAIDQTTKFLAIEKIPGSGIFLIDQSWLNLKLIIVKNTGLAFGFGASNIAAAGLTVITLAIILALLVKALKTKNHTLAIAACVLFAAALSNLLDRVLHGGVIDFLSISIYNFDWPAFNPADIFITVAAIWLIIKWPRKKICTD